MKQKNAWKIAGCSFLIAAGLAVICLFVPDGQLLSDVRGEMESTRGVAFSGVVPMNLYGYALAGAAALSLCAIMLLNRDRAGAIRFCAGALWLGLAMSRILFCLVNLAVFALCPLSVAYLLTGGLSLYGALFGVLTAALLCGRKSAPSCRSLTVSLAVFIPGARIAEYFSPESLGIGVDVEFSNLFSVPSMFGDVLNVRLIEILIAAALLIAVILRERKPERSWKDGLRVYLFLFAAIQILMESLRRDGHMIWGFVKAQQVLSLLTATVCLTMLTSGRRRVASLILSSVAGALCFAMEKQLDRGYVPVSDWANYGAYAFIIFAYLAIGIILIRKSGKEIGRDALTNR